MGACRNRRLEAEAQFTAMDGIVGTHRVQNLAHPDLSGPTNASNTFMLA